MGTLKVLLDFVVSSYRIPVQIYVYMSSLKTWNSDLSDCLTLKAKEV